MTITSPATSVRFDHRGFAHLVYANLAICGVLGGRYVFAAEKALTLDQKLIVACHRVDPLSVVRLIRAGANVKASFGEHNVRVDPLKDPWSGDTYVAAESWTPLIALANADEYPAPPPHLIPDIWGKQDRIQQERQRIEKFELHERRVSEMSILLILLSHNIDVNSADNRGSTALHTAVRNKKAEFVRVLLSFGANVNTKRHIYIDGPDDITPLHHASDSMELFQLLLAHGADPKAKDSQGETPIDWVRQDDQRDFDVVESSNGIQVQSRQRRSP